MQSSSVLAEPFQPATLPPALMALHDALANAGNDTARRQVAMAIIKEYFSYFGPTGMRTDMWQLLAATLTNDLMPVFKEAQQCSNLLFFYEFTLMMMDAVLVISVYPDLARE